MNCLEILLFLDIIKLRALPSDAGWILLLRVLLQVLLRVHLRVLLRVTSLDVVLQYCRQLKMSCQAATLPSMQGNVSKTLVQFGGRWLRIRTVRWRTTTNVAILGAGAHLQSREEVTSTLGRENSHAATNVPGQKIRRSEIMRGGAETDIGTGTRTGTETETVADVRNLRWNRRVHKRMSLMSSKSNRKVRVLKLEFKHLRLWIQVKSKTFFN